MKTIKKQFVAILSSLTLISSVSGFYVSADNSQNELSNYDDVNLSLINSRLEEFDLGVTNDNLYLSDAYTVYNFEDNSIISDCLSYFLIDEDNDALIGEFIVFSNGDLNYMSTEGTVFEDYYNHNTDFALGYDSSGGLVTVSEEDYYSINDLELDTSNLDFDLQGIESYYECSPVASINSATVIASRILNDVEHVPNAEINGHGMCWAAVLSMKLNRESPYLYTLNTYNVFYNCNNHGINTTGTPSGIVDAYNLFGYNVTLVNNYNPTASYIYNKLCNNKTIHATIYQTGDSTGHAILIKGIKVTTAATIVYCDDPNQPNPIYSYNSQSNSGLSNTQCMNSHIVWNFPNMSPYYDTCVRIFY